MHLTTFLLAAACLILPARADEPPLRDLLRDGLYAEEVNRDPEAAAKHYEQVLARYSEQRAFAASALFRLAEVRRKQDRKDDAIQLYQHLLTEFPGAESETKLARENLAALGGKMPAAKGPAPDAESLELARLESLAKTAPDIILDPHTLQQAANQGRSKVVAYLLAAGSRPYAGDALRIAAENGYLEIVRQLTAGDAPVPADVATAGIQAAIHGKRFTILDFLLQRGFKSGEMSGVYDCYQGSSALGYALLTDSPQCAEILLKHGADLDAISGAIASGTNSEGTALHWVIAAGKFDAANWLLDKGAKPDIPHPGSGTTPLHEAVSQSSDRAFAMMQRLLESGADPNRRTANSEIANPSRPGLHSRPGLQNVTPWELAVRSNYKPTEKLRLLLKHGADLKSDRQLIRRLFESQSQPNMDYLKLLVDAGARPDDEWMKNSIQSHPGEARDYLVEKFAIPGFVNDSTIQLVINGPTRVMPSNIAVRSGDTPPPDLGAWLLANHESSDWGTNAGDPLNHQWLIWRKGSDGVLAKQELDFLGNAPVPPLQWGDIVESRINYQRGHVALSGVKGLPRKIVAALRRRIAFPITFEADGMSREIMVRGDRLFFDPTKNEVPLVSLSGVAQFLWQPGWPWQQRRPRPPGQDEVDWPVFHIMRKGWPDVRLSCDSIEVANFQLEAGDRVRVEISEQVRADLAATRRECVTLKVDGYPFAKSFVVNNNGKTVVASIPTLIQALVDTQVPFDVRWMDLGKTKEQDQAILAEEYSPFHQFSLLTHPDLARIRIRRLQEGGGEKAIDVNLMEIINASTEQTTAQEARKADVLLQPGDVVEVSLLKDRLVEPWKGFAAREEAFFAKALSGRVRFTDKQGNITMRELLYKAPRFVEMGNGWIPVPPETGIPSMLGFWLTLNEFMEIEIKRGEIQEKKLSSSRVFLLDGDEVRPRNWGSQPVPGSPSR